MVTGVVRGEFVELWLPLPLLLKRVARLFVLPLLLLSVLDMRRESLDMFRLKREASLSFSLSAGPAEGGLDRVGRLGRRVPRLFATARKVLFFSSTGVAGTEAEPTVPKLVPDTEPAKLESSKARLLLRWSRELRPREFKAVLMSRLLRAEFNPKSAVPAEGGKARWTSGSVSRRETLESFSTVDFSKGIESECERDVASA